MSRLEDQAGIRAVGRAELNWRFSTFNARYTALKALGFNNKGAGEVANTDWPFIHADNQKQIKAVMPESEGL